MNADYSWIVIASIIISLVIVILGLLTSVIIACIQMHGASRIARGIIDSKELREYERNMKMDAHIDDLSQRVADEIRRNKY